MSLQNNSHSDVYKNFTSVNSYSYNASMSEHFRFQITSHATYMYRRQNVLDVKFDEDERSINGFGNATSSVPDPRVSGSTSQRYGSGSFIIMQKY